MLVVALLGQTALAGMTGGVCGMARAAHGDHVTIQAEELDLATPCLGEVHVTVDPAVADGVSFDMSEAIGAKISIHSGKAGSESKVQIASGACAPHARLLLTIAATTALSIHDSRETHFIVTGPLASLEGSLDSGGIEADAASSADLNLRGTATARFGALSRAAQIVMHDNADLAVDRADLDAFSLQVSDSSRVTVAGGRIDALTLSVEGTGSAVIGGTLNTAAITANGTGQVVIPRASGPVTRSGQGNVHVGVPPVVTVDSATAPAPPSAPPPPPPVNGVPNAPGVPGQSSSPGAQQTAPPPTSVPTPAPPSVQPGPGEVPPAQAVGSGRVAPPAPAAPPSSAAPARPTPPLPVTGGAAGATTAPSAPGAGGVGSAGARAATQAPVAPASPSVAPPPVPAVPNTSAGGAMSVPGSPLPPSPLPQDPGPGDGASAASPAPSHNEPTQNIQSQGAARPVAPSPAIAPSASAPTAPASPTPPSGQDTPHP